MAAHNKIKLTLEKILYIIARYSELTHFGYFLQVYLTSWPYQPSDQQYHFIGSMWRLSRDGLFVNFFLLRDVVQ